MILTSPPADGEPPAYVTIIHGAGGWNAMLMRWESPGYRRGIMYGVGDGTREAAIADAKRWAEPSRMDQEGLPVWIPPEPFALKL